MTSIEQSSHAGYNPEASVVEDEEGNILPINEGVDFSDELRPGVGALLKAEEVEAYIEAAMSSEELPTPGRTSLAERVAATSKIEIILKDFEAATNENERKKLRRMFDAQLDVLADTIYYRTQGVGEDELELNRTIIQSEINKAFSGNAEDYNDDVR